MPTRTGPTRALRLIPVVVLIALFSSACNYLDWGQDGPEREFFCDPTDIAVNDGHGGEHGHGGHEFPYHEEKGPLSAGHCLLLDYTIENAVEFASAYPTAGDAEDDGWFRLAPWIPGQGTHHIDLSYGIPTEFDWSRPTMLMYDNNNRSGALTGMVWMVNTGSGNPPPEGFYGDNDHWHNHQTLCYRNGRIVGDNTTDAECDALGGNNVDATGIWMVHVWLPEYDGWQATDIFNKSHPGIN